ncbi:MAG: hypothetical protein E7396_01535 [Ruminococcaceae bacterium]|nr:hypothetical protein [Oscillospiraceae bacterium]
MVIINSEGLFQKGRFGLKKTFGCIFKVILSGSLALFILSAFSLVYFNGPPIIPQPELITKNKFVPNRAWSYMGEGFGYGVTDSLGYNNVYYDDYTSPDVIVMGSSHMEAVHVPARNTCTSVMDKLFAEDDNADNNIKCLNIGRSGSFFDQSVSYFETVAKHFDTAKYIIVETKSLGWTIEQFEGMLNQKYRKQMGPRSFAANVTVAVPYLRLFVKQTEELFLQDKSADPLPLSTTQDKVEYATKMNEVVKMMASQAKEHGKQLVILHHNTFSYEEQQNAKSDDDPEQMKVLEDSCAENDVILVDVTDEFVDHYKNTYEVAYGFANSEIGEGHLNKVGHRIIGEELYKAINDHINK